MAEQRFPVGHPDSSIALVLRGTQARIETQTMVGPRSVCVASGSEDLIEAQLVDLAEAVSKALAYLKGVERG